MKTIYTFFALFLLLTTAVRAQDSTSVHIAQVSLAYPVGTAGTRSGDYANHFSLNAIYGVNGGVKGLELGGVANVNRGRVDGLQLGGVANVTTGSSRGLVAGGVLNQSQRQEGLHLAGVANLTADDMRGLQVGGVVNTARDVTGFQLSGVVNVAKTVKGLQIGVINLADSSDYAIGVLNLIKTGEKSIGVAVDETRTTLVSFRSGGRVLYSILGIGYNLKNEEAVYAMEGGIGAHLLTQRFFHLRAEAAAINLFDFGKGDYLRASLRLLPSVRFANFLELYAGPTLNYANTNQAESKELVDHFIWQKDSSRELQGVYLGLSGGVNILF
ncbi:hypothetical protein SAMN05421823_104145 [Catalinimonas alkaloidigena]|uniref:Uncharacterized protein n=1 Tax=Catalinimonas alkaloidigena TaxID=1075417 RepID=A0A1G9GL47_9BACT|nr:hypothetical protein [Catalinimonas alkaloidigena]SDL01332.1 hypothetical protein SAMN05421823_104145 [Catalinimonas alkaloidigena]